MLHGHRQVADREGLGELVVDAHLAAVGGVEHGQLDAGEGVADVEEAAGLAAGAVHGQGAADHGLEAEPVERGAELLVVVEAGQQPVVEQRLLGVDAVDDALVEVGGAEPVDPGGEVDVGGVGDLAGVVPAVGQLRERQRVGAALVLDLDVALFDVDVGAAVLTHRAELDQVAVGVVLEDREDDVEVVLHVVELREDRLRAPLHRVGRRRDLAVVDDRVGVEVPHDAVQQVVVAQVDQVDVDRAPRDLLPRRRPSGEVQDRGEAVAAGLGDQLAAQVVVGDCDLVAVGRQTHGRGPPEVTVAPQHQDTHSWLPSSHPADGRNLACSARIDPFAGPRGAGFRQVRPAPSSGRGRGLRVPGAWPPAGGTGGRTGRTALRTSRRTP